MEDDDGEVRCRLRVAELACHLHAINEKEAHLMRVSAERMDALGIDIDATLASARGMFARSGVEALHVRPTESGRAMPQGVLTRKSFANHAGTATRR